MIMVVPPLKAQFWGAQTSGVTHDLITVHFVDENNGWAGGASGMIVHTTDGGESWAVQNSGTTRAIENIQFADASHGWAACADPSGYGGHLIYTSDGGANWATVLGNRNYGFIFGLSVVDASTCWAASGYCEVFHTGNTGTDWDEIDVCSEASWSAGWMYGISFVDADYGWIVGGGYGNGTPGILRTTDRGATWSVQSFTNGEEFHGVTSVDRNNAWVWGGPWGGCTWGRILHTTNGGNSWQEQTNATTNSIWGASFVDPARGWAVGCNGTIQYTVDGGTTWLEQPSGTMNMLVGVSFVNATHGWAVGAAGTVLRYYGEFDYASVSGHVTLEDGLGDVTQAVVHANGYYPQNTHPAVDGSYQLDSVIVGSRLLSVSLAGYQTETRRVDVSESGVSGVNLTLHRLPPPPPEHLWAEVDVAGLVMLNWDDSADPFVNSYRIYRRTVPDTLWSFIGSSTLSESRDTLSARSFYQYAVTACDQSGSSPLESGYSNVVTVSFGEFPPQQLRANGNFDDHVHLSWLDGGDLPVYALAYDDSSVDNWWTFGSEYRLAVRFTPPEDAVYPMPLQSAQILLDGTGIIPLVKICPAGLDGYPDELHPLAEWANIPFEEHADWLIVNVDNGASLNTAGDFFVIWQLNYDAYLGVDFAAPDSRSFYMSGGQWSSYGGADWMCRASVGGSSAQGQVLAVGASQRCGTGSVPQVIAAEHLRDPNRPPAPVMKDSQNNHPKKEATSAAFMRVPQLEYHRNDRTEDERSIVTQYRVYRDGALLATPTETAYDDGIPEGVSHTYYVTAVYSSGNETAASPSISAQCAMAPGAPTDFAGLESGGHTQMRLTWTDPTVNADGTPCTDQVGIHLYRNGNFIADIPSGVQEYTDTPPGARYYTWTVRAFDEVNNTGAGPEFQGAIGTSISGLVVLDGGNDYPVNVQIHLDDSNELYIGPDWDGSYILYPVSVGPHSVTASLWGYESATVAVVVPAEGLPGVNLTLRRLPPEAPTHLRAVADTTGVVSIQWQASQDPLVDLYALYRRVQGDSTWTLFRTCACTAETDTLLLTGYYQYVVTATDTNASIPVVSGYSNLVTVPFGNLAPHSLQVEGGFDDHVHLSWYDGRVSAISYPLIYDDSTAESFWNWGDGWHLSVRFTPPEEALYPLPLQSVQLFVEGGGIIPIVMICPADAAGYPDEAHPYVQWTNVEVGEPAGWLILNAEFGTMLPSAGDFFVSWQASDVPRIAVDYSGGADRSYYGQSGQWWSYWTNWMCRAWVGGRHGEGQVLSVGEPLTQGAGEVPVMLVNPDRLPLARDIRSGPMAWIKAPMLEYRSDRRGSRSLDALANYLVYRDGNLIASPVTTEYDDYVAENAPHTYSVAARYSNGEESAPSAPVAGTCNMAPGTATGFSGSTPNAETEIYLTWTDPAVNADGTPCLDLAGLRLYRDEQFVAEIAAGAEQYTDVIPEKGIFTWTLVAFDEAGNIGSPARFGTIGAELVAHYPFTGDAADSSGYDRDGTVYNAVLTSDRYGLPDLAYHFNGNDARIELGNWFDYREFSICMWVKPAATQTTWADIIENNHSGGPTPRSWCFQQDVGSTNRMEFSILPAPPPDPVQLTADVWQHVVLIKDSIGMRVYIDGILVRSVSLSDDPTYDGTQTLGLGRWWNSGYPERFWNGDLDDIRIYGGGLNASEVALIYSIEAVPDTTIVESPPAAPDSLVIRYDPSARLLRLDWQPVTADVNGNPVSPSYYVVYRSSDGVHWDSLGIPTPPDTTHFTDSTVSTDRRYYQVTARSGALPTVDMVHVPAGPYTMGSTVVGGDALPEHTVNVPAFYIDVHPVTNAQYKAFCDATSREYPPDPGFSGMPNYFVNPAYANYPVVMVDWNDASSYAAWAGKRLPTEAEWERAAKGYTDNRQWPWGNTWIASNANTVNNPVDGYDYTSPVGSYPEGVSPAGCLDMAGNVWEWCEDDWHDSYFQSPTDGSAWVESPRRPDRVVRGGSWLDYRQEIGAQCSFRSNYNLEYRRLDAGFRCARN
jgi:formylglycine-generating enzyme required for sulfatase activity/photosystem II stability/assembly factor-like uncharacterized protein